LRRLWRLLRPTRGAGPRLLSGWFGRLVFRLAGLGVRSRAHLAPDAPTALLLGDAAERIYLQLEPADRQRLHALPGVLRRLQADALATAESPAEERRRSTALAALETIRLDLLRLRSGRADPGTLTQDLETVQRLAESVDRLLATPDPTAP